MWQIDYPKLYDAVLKVDSSLEPLISYIRKIKYSLADFKWLIDKINQESSDNADMYKNALLDISLPYCVHYAYSIYQTYKVELADCIQDCIVRISDYIQNYKLNPNTPFTLRLRMHLKTFFEHMGYYTKIIPTIHLDDLEDYDLKETGALAYNQDDRYLIDEMILDIVAERLDFAMDRFFTERECYVIELRFGFIDGKTRTREEIAVLLGVTRERIRQNEASALRKLRGRDRTIRLYPLMSALDSKWIE